MRIYVVGRHPTAGLKEAGHDVVGQEDVSFISVTHAITELSRLFDLAHNKNAHLVFQATSVYLTTALFALKSNEWFPVLVGLVVSKPGERQPTQTLTIGPREDDDDRDMIVGLLATVAPRVRTTGDYHTGELTLEYEPQSSFTYSHIEWLR